MAHRVRLFTALVLGAAMAMTGCAPAPTNEQIEAAIRASLELEQNPPELDFANMNVPHRYSGKAGVGIFSLDGKTARKYSIVYDKASRSFKAGFEAYENSEDGTLYRVQDEGTPVPTEYAEFFDFGDSDERYLLLFAGRGESFADMRAEFELQKRPHIDSRTLSVFNECDLGGDTLVLIVPRYKGLNVSINRIFEGEATYKSAQIAELDDKPVYIMCDFDDEQPRYEVHISSYAPGYYFAATEEFLARKALYYQVNAN